MARNQLLNITIWTALLAPVVYIGVMIVRIQNGEWDLLGPEPGRAVTQFLGTWALNSLLLTLTLSPLKRSPLSINLISYRRRMGLFAFTYMLLHLLAYMTMMLGWQWQDLNDEVVKRPYMVVGVFALLLTIPLAITSTRNWQRRLGRRWKKLHYSVYLVAALSMVHILLQVRSSWTEFVVYSSVLSLLLIERLLNRQKTA
ncbi:protein-methionine-sulfoxide reductase heme-binding subunit MsrQ [Thalassolituus marinus]|uniref:Protein-methionine-sulfoxide reductase heme-binding subunit MsrQ n=1 Tax=Thalassolituus marinus TaxID=671053 RepID=A0ABS7ZRJ9_9GAMM|nr:ferric reductase-like transmembrane domain-containing protein [Thalassolituus marinus]MCA6064399.1 ferric reductase-like transmembrane domain-containing protein [Thalassolituus marinus]